MSEKWWWSVSRTKNIPTKKRFAFSCSANKKRERENKKKKKNILNPSQILLLEKVTLTKDFDMKHIENFNYVNDIMWK